MQPLYTQEQYDNTKSHGTLPLQCQGCNKKFYRQKRTIDDVTRRKKGSSNFCSLKCHGASVRSRIATNCTQCGVQFERLTNQFNKSSNHFCSRSCAGTYNTTHKTHGTRRSKLEVWLEQQLPALYPSLEFHFNRKDAIISELDIYIPSLKLAFELNGIFHYEPIYGPEKLAQIQNNDERKYQACIERGIELCLIDVSSFSYFKISGAERYLDMMKSIINKKLTAEDKGADPSLRLTT